MGEELSEQRKRELNIIEQKAFLSEAKERFERILNFNTHLPDDILREFELARTVTGSHVSALDYMEKLEDAQVKAEKLNKQATGYVIAGAACFIGVFVISIIQLHKKKKESLEANENES